MMGSAMNPSLMENYLDPTIIRKGIDEIKEQMRDVQREAHQIESEMDGRFKDMVGRRESQARGMPYSLTQELEDRKKRDGRLVDAVEEVTGFAKTRALVMQRLGGEFDYS